jgi:hypothetical protein
VGVVGFMGCQTKSCKKGQEFEAARRLTEML